MFNFMPQCSKMWYIILNALKFTNVAYMKQIVIYYVLICTAETTLHNRIHFEGIFWGIFPTLCFGDCKYLMFLVSPSFHILSQTTGPWFTFRMIDGCIPADFTQHQASPPWFLEVITPVAAGDQSQQIIIIMMIMIIIKKTDKISA